MCVCVDIYVCMCGHICVYVENEYIYVYPIFFCGISVYVHIYVCMCGHICVYAENDSCE